MIDFLISDVRGFTITKIAFSLQKVHHVHDTLRQTMERPSRHPSQLLCHAFISWSLATGICTSAQSYSSDKVSPFFQKAVLINQCPVLIVTEQIIKNISEKNSCKKCPTWIKHRQSNTFRAGLLHDDWRKWHIRCSHFYFFPVYSGKIQASHRAIPIPKSTMIPI